MTRFTPAQTSPIPSVTMNAFTPAAYAVSRFEFKWKEGGFMFTVLSTRFLPPATALVPIYFLYVKFGLVNNLLGLVVAYAGLNLPIVIWVMRSFIDETREVLQNIRR